MLHCASRISCSVLHRVFDRDNLPKRFKVCNEHITAALLDPDQKRLSLLDKYLPNETKSSYLQRKVKEFGIAISGPEKDQSVTLFSHLNLYRFLFDYLFTEKFNIHQLC